MYACVSVGVGGKRERTQELAHTIVKLSEEWLSRYKIYRVGPQDRKIAGRLELLALTEAVVFQQSKRS